MVLALVVAGGCGAGSPEVVTMGRQGDIDASAYLRGYLASHTRTFAEPEATIEELDDRRRSARGAERRAAMRALALAHLLAADQTADDREAARHRRKAIRMAGYAARGSGDDYLEAEMAFVELWSAWRAERRGAGRIAERFTRRHRTAGDLFIAAWLIKGEIALAGERYEEALTAYRYVLGMLDHPLYAFALYRTAEAYKADGQLEEAREALHEVRQLACADEIAPEAEEIALRAAAETRTGVRHDPDGRRRPETCPPVSNEPPAAEGPPE